jgi:hypothetical protein
MLRKAQAPNLSSKWASQVPCSRKSPTQYLIFLFIIANGKTGGTFGRRARTLASASSRKQRSKSRVPATWTKWWSRRELTATWFQKTAPWNVMSRAHVRHSMHVNSLLIFSGVSLIDVVRFDNTYSWVSGKDLSYQIDVLDPSQDPDIVSTSLWINVAFKL